MTELTAHLLKRLPGIPVEAKPTRLVISCRLHQVNRNPASTLFYMDFRKQLSD